MKSIRWITVFLLVSVLAGCATNNSKSDSGITAEKAYSRLGFQYLQSGDTANAKTSFQRALEIASNDAEAHNGLALTFQLEGDKALAEKYFIKATSLAPQSAMMHNNFGAFLYGNKRYAEACKVLARATEDPFYKHRSQAFENLGRCYLNLDRKDAAKHAFQRALQVSASRPVSLVELSDILLLEGNEIESEKYFSRFLEFVEQRRVQHSAKSLWVGIRIARFNGNTTRAATYALILKNLHPDSTEYQEYEESAR